MAKSKHNWEEIEHDYITGRLSYRELAIKYKVSAGRTEKVGKNGNWVEKRRSYRDALKKDAIAETKKTTVLDRARFDELTNVVCDASLTAMAVTAAEKHKGLKGETPQPMSAKDAEAMLAVAQKAQEIKYRSLGIPPPKTQSQIDAEEAFKHYQDKLAEHMAKLSATATVIKPSSGNGGPSLNPNDFIEVEIEEPTQGPSKN